MTLGQQSWGCVGALTRGLFSVVTPMVECRLCLAKSAAAEALLYGRRPTVGHTRMLNCAEGQHHPHPRLTQGSAVLEKNPESTHMI